MEEALDQSNPVTDAARPRRRRATDAGPDAVPHLEELDSVIAVIPDVTVDLSVARHKSVDMYAPAWTTKGAHPRASERSRRPG
jgi:hypothetical protein